MLSDGLCGICGKIETVTHFLIECPSTNETCAAVLAACSNLNLSLTIDIILSDSRLHDIIISSLHRNL